MAIRPEDILIKNPPLADVEQALAFVKGITGADNAKSKAYVEEAYRLYPESGISPEVMVAQWDLYTERGTQPAWLNRFDAAGIRGADAGSLQHTWSSAARSAQGQAVHLSAYVEGYNRNLRRYLLEDPRYLAVLRSDWAGSVTTLADLSGKWTSSLDYGHRVAERLQYIRDFTIPPPIPVPTSKIGSYGVPSIDQWDSSFIAASDAVFRKRAVRVDPRFIKAMMDVETDHRKGNYPPDACRPCDGEDCVPACGPMQIKFDYHRQRCPECDLTTVPGQIELATHIIGMTMLGRNLDEYGAFLAVYFPTDDVNGTTQQWYVNRIRSLIATMEADVTPTPTPTPGPVILPPDLTWIGTQNYGIREAGQQPRFIVHHITDDMVLDNVIGWFRNPSSYASSHFVIDRDGRIYQFVSTRNYAWTNGDYYTGQFPSNSSRVARRDIPRLNSAIDQCMNNGWNMNGWCISIEYIGTPSRPPTNEQYESGIAISKYAVAAYPTISPHRMGQLRHKDINPVTRNYCPGPNFDLSRIITALGGDPNKLS